MIRRGTQVPHIDLPAGVPGIRSLFDFRPETARPLLALVETLLRGDNTLSRGERELIASYVSRLNACGFCEASHSAFAAVELGEDWALVEAVKDDPASAPVSEKLRALLAIAAQVQQGGLSVSETAVAAAKAAGASDVEIHDSVLIAAAFCMFNRYVDGLGTTEASPEQYQAAGIRISTKGYGARFRTNS